MGKKQHQKDKLYLTTKEWKESYGGHKDDSSTRIQRAAFKRLPFTHCAYSFLPFEVPVCTVEGTIFDLVHITSYIKKHGINPANGKKLSTKDLIRLNFAKDSEGNFRCPVTYRVFTLNSLIVAIKPTGNVYSMEAVDELNLKRNYLKDLLNDTPFQRKDIIVLQDPNNLEKFNIEAFHHVQFDTKTKEEIAAEKKLAESPMFFLNSISNEAKQTLSQLEKEYNAKDQEAETSRTADKVNAAHYSQGRVAASLTSTAMAPETLNKAEVLDEDVVKYSRVKKNGYVQLITNHGPLNLELYAKQAPKACENFIEHCRQGYYDNTKFHRLIKHFMLQGGDPSGTGKGGKSIWGKPFEDEINSNFHHNTRGVLSMANAGSNTNGSQFFITFRPCKHLDGKHTIFGRLVGGNETLSSIEKVETDIDDKPVQPVVLMTANVFVDPFEEAAKQVEQERKEAEQEADEERKKNETMTTDDTTHNVKKPKAYSSGVGKYIKPEMKSNLKRSAVDEANGDGESIIRKKMAHRPFTDFSSW